MVKRGSLLRVVVSSRPARHRLKGAVVVVLFTSVLAGVGVANDHFYVLKDGRKVGLTRSKDELGLKFHHCDDVEACARRLATAGHGVVENFAEAPKARMKRLRVPEASAALRQAVLQDPAVVEARPLYRFEGSSTPVVSSGAMVVKVRGDLDDVQRAELWDDYRSLEVDALRGLHGVYVVRPADDDEDEVLLAERLYEDDRTLWAHPDFYRPTQRRQVASDQYYHLQWHLDNTGQTRGTVDADIDAPEAWVISEGAGVLFGMFDDSCDVDHEDLRDNYIGIGQDISVPFFDEDYTNPRPKLSDDAHGTAVMGLAVAAANSVGVRGVAHRARFTATRGLTDFVTSESFTATAYTFAIEQNVDVHINSWGYINLPDPPVVVDAIDTAFREGRDPDGPGGQPPRGMVIVFATGNENVELIAGFELSALPQVIGVGASTSDDIRASFSNFGADMEFLGTGGGNINLGITTTDVHDYPAGVTQGYNAAGVGVEPGTATVFGPDIDPGGNYTGFFGGTSAACPIAAGVAALILSVNPDLTATDVRVVMEHTCDQIDAANAQYDVVTGKSAKYGHGRINAHRAVVAASNSLTDGGLVWPDVPTDLQVVGSTLHWKSTSGASEFLVLEIDNVLDNAIQDGACYDSQQGGCADATLVDLPADVIPHFVACATDPCVAGDEQSFDFVPPVVGTKRLGVYARNSIGRYSFGAKAEVSAAQPPKVTITAQPLEGDSPLTVYFKGNAVSLSDVAIDDSKTAWDFDVDDNNDLPDATTRTANNALDPYVVAPGDNRIFVARLTMYDLQGRSGSAEVGILVHGPKLDDTNDTVSDNDVQIIVGLPGTPGSDVDVGTSPFSVVLTIDTTGLSGTPKSVEWDLGDGTRATSLVVSHTYENETDFAVRIPIVATVTTTSGATPVSTSATRFITVQPGIPVVDPGDPNLPGTNPGGAGGAAVPCSGVGMIPLLLTLTSLLGMRRRH